MQILIYGAGGFGRGVAWLATVARHSGEPYEPVAFIDDSEQNWARIVNDLPVLGLDDALDRFPDAAVVSGIGNGPLRRLTMERVRERGGRWATLIHRNVEMSKWIELGDGAVICAGNILNTNIVIGKQVQMNLACTLGHDVRMGDYVTLSPGVHVSGNVTMENGVFIGTGAVIINGTSDEPLVIGENAVVGAGASVICSVPANTTVVGVPAKVLQR
jgi:sugar O-acyltransferase (sialic acid O-acetyltransferase NeuD family)